MCCRLGVSTILACHPLRHDGLCGGELAGDHPGDDGFHVDTACFCSGALRLPLAQAIRLTDLLSPSCCRQPFRGIHGIAQRICRACLELLAEGAEMV
jgi:hypothetical protein